MKSQSHVNHELLRFRNDLRFERNPILILNEALDNLHVPHDVNEQTIETFLQLGAKQLAEKIF